MPDYVAPARLYHTLDRSRIVEEGDSAAAFLVVGKGAVLSEAEAKRFAGLTKYLKEYRAPDLVKVEEALLQDAVDRGAHGEAESRRGQVERLKAQQTTGAEGMDVPVGRSLGDGAPTPLESQPDSGNPHELRVGGRPRVVKVDKAKDE